MGQVSKVNQMWMPQKRAILSTGGIGANFELPCGGWSQKLHGRTLTELLRDEFKYAGRERGIVGERTAFVSVCGTYHIMDMVPSDSESRPKLHRPTVWIWIQACCSLPVQL